MLTGLCTFTSLLCCPIIHTVEKTGIGWVGVHISRKFFRCLLYFSDFSKKKKTKQKKKQKKKKKQTNKKKKKKATTKKHVLWVLNRSPSANNKGNHVTLRLISDALPHFLLYKMVKWVNCLNSEEMNTFDL